MRGAVAGAEVSTLRVSEPQERLILVLFDKRECMSLKQAADVAGKSELTMQAWPRNTGWADGSGAGFGPSAGSHWRCFWTAIGML